MKAAAIMMALIFLLSPVFASQLNVKVTVTQGTLAVGTNVTVVTDGVELYNQKAGLDGFANFNVTPGSYFVLLRRYPYPLHVVLLDIQNDTTVTLSMRQLVSYANVYGQMTGPSDFANATVAAYADGVAAKHTKTDKYGKYVMSFLSEGNYEMQFSAPGFETGKEEAYLPAADFREVNAKLKKEVPPPEPRVSFTAPSSSQLGSIIEASLSKGGKAMAGENVSIRTPSGLLYSKTDSSGKVRVSAAEAGEYEFSFGAFSAVVLVSEPETPEQNGTNETAPPELPPVSPPELPKKEESNFALLGLAGLGAIVLAGAVLLALAVKYFQDKKQGGQGGAAKETNQSSEGAPHRHESAHHKHAKKSK